ncbi:MAG: helix-turn-helix transcriptional regulator [Jatrophihabitans sp.]
MPPAQASLASHAAGESAARLAEAAKVLSASLFPALVLEVPSEKIIAASRAASELLQPGGGEVVGRLLEDFTVDRPDRGSHLFAGGKLNGVETPWVLRRPGSDDQPVRMWIRSFDHEPASRFVLVLIVAGEAVRLPAPTAESEAAAVVGTADASLLIERISSDAEALFGRPVIDLLGRSLISLVSAGDVANCLAALSEASHRQHGVTLYLDIRVAPETAVGRGCEVLILPLQPAPSCAFVFLPSTVALPRARISDDLSEILLRLGRGAEVAQVARALTRALTEKNLPGISRLTTRQLEILTRLLEGDRPPAIATKLFLTQSTVRNHLATVYTKLGVSSQQELLDLVRAARQVHEDA